MSVVPACHPSVRIHCCLMAISAFYSHLTLTYHLLLAQSPEENVPVPVCCVGLGGMSVGSVVFIHRFVHYLLSFTTVNSKYSLVFCLWAYVKHCLWRLVICHSSLLTVCPVRPLRQTDRVVAYLALQHVPYTGPESAYTTWLSSPRCVKIRWALKAGYSVGYQSVYD